MRTRIILVRHGRSNYNDLGIFQGSSDDSFLTAKGIETAAQTANHLSQFPIEAIYLSPLTRAQQTGHIIQSNCETPPPSYLLDDLREIDLPDWQQLAYQVVREQQTDHYQSWKETPNDFQMRSRYPVRDLFNRAREVWSEIRSNHEGQTVLIVSHGGTIQALIATALGLDESSFHRMQQSNCGISVLSFSSDLNSTPQLEALNLTQHLGEHLPKLKEGKKGLRQLLWVKPEVPDFIPPSIDLTPYQNLNLKTELKIVSADRVIDRLQQILGPTLTPSSLNLETGKCVILHEPTSLKHSIIQALNLTFTPSDL